MATSPSPTTTKKRAPEKSPPPAAAAAEEEEDSGLSLTAARRLDIEEYTRVYAKTGSFIRKDSDEMAPFEIINAISWLPDCPIVASLTRRSREYALVDPAFLTAYCLMRSAFNDPVEEFPIAATDDILHMLSDSFYQGSVTYHIRGLDPIRETSLFTLSYFCNIDGCKLSQLANQLSHLRPLPENRDSGMPAVPMSRPEHCNGGSRAERKTTWCMAAGDVPRTRPAEELAKEHVRIARRKFEHEYEVFMYAETALRSVCSHPSWTRAEAYSAAVDDKIERGDRRTCISCGLERRLPHPAGAKE